MTHWDYRVFKHTHEHFEPTYAIHEAYYDATGNVDGWTRYRSELYAETVEELKLSLEMMLLAFNKPVLNYGPE